jgi:tRNA dimethylallyltransferase
MEPLTTNYQLLTTAPLVVLVGETASGKSDLAMEIAGRFNGEIIAADAWTVRKGVDIGTAKPSPADRSRVPHHLLSIVEPCGDFTAAVFKRLANEAISDISFRGKLPIMAGGTGLYIDGVVYDYGFLPQGDREARKKLNNLTIEQLRTVIRGRGLDDSGVDVRNKRRLIRLLETEGAPHTRGDLRTNTLLLGVRVDREALRERIETRVDRMLQQGLEQEVHQLAHTYGWECEALKGIGYREWREYFEGSQDLGKTRARIINATLGLAKRQRTWFKRNKSIRWVTSTDEAVKLTTDFLNNTGGV